MKTIQSLLVASAVTIGVTLTTASAADVAASPRFRQTLDKRNAVAHTGTSPNLISNTYAGSAAKWGLTTVPRVVPSGHPTRNLVSGSYVGAGSKHPYPPPPGSEVAPLFAQAATGKTCEMDCCVKK